MDAKLPYVRFSDRVIADSYTTRLCRRLFFMDVKLMYIHFIDRDTTKFNPFLK